MVYKKYELFYGIVGALAYLRKAHVNFFIFIRLPGCSFSASVSAVRSGRISVQFFGGNF
jgi:hypothetical protein